MYNDLYVAGITKHGAIFLASRLGNPLLIHAIGKETMVPALYLTLHPLIIFRGKSDPNASNISNGSVSSTAENEETLRQRYCIKNHPSLPIFACSDGYLMCVFKLESAFSTQSRLIREIMHETIGLLNSVSKTTQSDKNHQHLENPFEKSSRSRRRKSHNQGLNTSTNYENNNIPEWGLASLQTTGSNMQSENSGSDSGVDSNDMKEKNSKFGKKTSSVNNMKIAEGKIIFSYLPQVLPISHETLKTDTVVNKMENAFEFLQSSWCILTSKKYLKICKIYLH